MAVALTDGIDVQAEGVCAAPEDAKTLAEVGRGMVALGRLTLSGKYSEAMTLFDAIDVVAEEKLIRASVKMTAADFERLLAAFKEGRVSKDLRGRKPYQAYLVFIATVPLVFLWVVGLPQGRPAGTLARNAG